MLTVTQNIKERCLNEQPPKGLSRKDHIITILYSELARLLGYTGEEIKTIDKSVQQEGELFSFKPGKLNIVLMLGIQGSGKTTVSAKLARWFTKHGHRVGVVGADTFRPGALTQLRMNCSKINVEVYGKEGENDAVRIVGDGIDYFRKQNIDIVIVDTAGRHKEESGLLVEMTGMYEVAKPELVLLVIDGDYRSTGF